MRFDKENWDYNTLDEILGLHQSFNLNKKVSARRSFAFDEETQTWRAEAIDLLYTGFAFATLYPSGKVRGRAQQSGVTSGFINAFDKVLQDTGVQGINGEPLILDSSGLWCSNDDREINIQDQWGYLN